MLQCLDEVILAPILTKVKRFAKVLGVPYIVGEVSSAKATEDQRRWLMRKLAVGFMIFALLLVAMPASASVQNGLGLGLGYDHAMKSGPHAVFDLRLRALSVTPLELNVSYLADHGMGFNLNLYLIHTKWVKWHFIDPGVYLPLGTTMVNNTDLRRKYDLSFGTGIEVKTWRKIVVYANARWYLPDPATALGEAKRRGENAGNADKSFGDGIDTTMDCVKDTYLRAAKDWHLTVGAMWFF